MEEVQELTKRPAVVSRDYVLGLLSRVFGRRFPDHLVPARGRDPKRLDGAGGSICPDHLLEGWLTYLEKMGVVVRNDDAYSLPGSPHALADLPEDAQRHLHRAIVAHARSPACPAVLHRVIPALPSGGSGSVSQSSTPQQAAPPRAPSRDPRALERTLWNRERHLHELSAFGPKASAMFDWIVESIRTALQPAPARANERKRLAEERRRAAQERRTARRKATEEAIASADAPTLAWFWHNAVEHLCAPCGDPNAEHIHVFWITSHKLAVAAETLARPHRSLLALRGATTGLSGNVDLVQMFFATDPVFVPLRQQAAAEVSEILVAFELQAQREATRPTAPEGSASGHWVPARSLVKEDDDRFSTPAKIKAFCIKHGIPHRPGVTKNGKPWTQRCDVQLEAWETKVADLDAEVQHLQDTADAMTANRPRFKAWRGEGRDDPK